MNPGIEYYRAFGLQAYGTLRVLKTPTAGDTVTINGDVFTYGTDFWGDTAHKTAESLVAAINGDRARYAGTTNQLNPSRAYFAYFVGDRVVVMASVPGTAGNSITLATSVATTFSVSGATLSGGVDGTMTFTGTATAELPAATALTKRTVTAGSRTMTSSAIPLTAAPAKFTKLDFIANGAVTFGTSGAQPFSIVANVWYTYHAPPGCILDANDLYFNGTAPTAVAYIYAN